MWFKNLRIYRLDPQWQCDRASLEKALSAQVFNPESASATEMQRLGWVPAVGDQDLVYANDGQFLITLRSEKKLLPASVVNQFATEKAREIEEQQGYSPGRRQMKEIKEQVTDTLLPRAFSLRQDTRVWIDSRNHWLVIDTGSSAKSDEVIGMLAKAIDPLPASMLHVATSPCAKMTILRSIRMRSWPPPVPGAEKFVTCAKALKRMMPKSTLKWASNAPNWP